KSKRAKEQKSKRAKEQKSKRAKEQKSKRAKEYGVTGWVGRAAVVRIEPGERFRPVEALIAYVRQQVLPSQPFSPMGLLEILPVRAPGATAANLQKGLEQAGHPTSKRTVELPRLFPLQCNSKGPPFGWYWPLGSTAELPGPSTCYALTMRLVESSIRPLLPTDLLGVLEHRSFRVDKAL
ncbi:MAG: hypothetical protein KJ843_24885, partial [Alphaproteobacteria bacterium]|nr:hypothetical protein [Alphaproteobacteria bacterium]